MTTIETDFTLVGLPGDTVFLLIPETEAAQAWADEYLPPDAPMHGRGIAIEHRYIGDILGGIENDGLTVHP